MNRRPTFQNTGYTQDSGAGSSLVVQQEWEQWASIIDSSGSNFIAEGQTLSAAFYKVVTRFDGRFNSNTRMVYEGQICKCENMDIVEEGQKRFLSFRFSKTDTWVDLS